MSKKGKAKPKIISCEDYDNHQECMLDLEGNTLCGLKPCRIQLVKDNSEEADRDG